MIYGGINFYSIFYSKFFFYCFLIRVIEWEKKILDIDGLLYLKFLKLVGLFLMKIKEVEFYVLCRKVGGSF